MNSFAKFFFRPGQGELIDTVVRLEPDGRSSLRGYVVDADNKPVIGAVVMLYEGANGRNLIEQAFTDDDGQFVFGPLAAGKLHMVKVFKNSVNVRELEIIT